MYKYKTLFLTHNVCACCCNIMYCEVYGYKCEPTTVVYLLSLTQSETTTCELAQGIRRTESFLQR